MCKRVYLVGHCSPDSSYLAMTVTAAAPAVTVRRVNDEAALAAALADGPHLLLVNRQLDGVFDSWEGLDLIARVRGSHPSTRMMLVSNYPEAQAAAEKAGALPGFGKANQNTAETRQRIRLALGQ